MKDLDIGQIKNERCDSVFVCNREIEGRMGEGVEREKMSND